MFRYVITGIYKRVVNKNGWWVEIVGLKVHRGIEAVKTF